MIQRILIIDNQDSFVFNLAEEFSLQHCQVDVFRDYWPLAEALDFIRSQAVGALVFSPGPGSPDQAKLCHQLLDEIELKMPVLGVCLGHQVIVEHFGGKVVRCPELVHGRSSVLHHLNRGIFKGLPETLTIGRYHSLAAESLGDYLDAVAFSNNIVMAIQHRDRPLFGVQFHPESVLTPMGSQLIENFLKEVR